MKEKAIARVYISMKWRNKRIGKGFSKGELREAGLTPHEARLSNIPIDQRRRTTHLWNTEFLKRRMIIVPLTEIKGIGDVTSKKLKAAGIQDAHDLATGNINKLIELGYSKKTLIKWQADAKKILAS